MSELYGKNIIEHIKMVDAAQETMRAYFIEKSSIWRAIVDHIMNSDVCVIIDRKNKACDVRFNTARSVISSEASLVFDFFVDYDSESDQHHIFVPIDLELDFTNKKFDNWLGQMAKEQLAAKVRKVVDTFSGVAKDFGVDFAEVKENIGKNVEVMGKKVSEMMDAFKKFVAKK